MFGKRLPNDHRHPARHPAGLSQKFNDNLVSFCGGNYAPGAIWKVYLLQHPRPQESLNKLGQAIVGQDAGCVPGLGALLGSLGHHHEELES